MYHYVLLVMILALAALTLAGDGRDSSGRRKDVPEALYWDFPRIEPPESFPDHPRLFLSADEITALKAAYADDGAFREAIDEKLAELRPLAQEPRLPSESIGDNLDIAKQAASFAVAYVLTDEAVFAEAAAAILKRYAEVFPGYEPGHLKGLATSAALEECVWAVDAAGAYDLIYNSGTLTEADKQAIERDVFRASAEVLRHCNHAYRSNWRIRAVGGVAAMAFVIGDRELIDEVFNGFRDETGMLVRDGLVHHMTWSILADGIYYERSQSYSEEIGDAMGHLLAAARHSGIDLWDYGFAGSDYDAGADPDRVFGATRPKTVQSVYDAVLFRAFGNGTLAKVANSYWNHLGRRDGWALAWRAYDDDRYAWPLVCDPEGWLHDLRDLMFMPPRVPTGTIDFAADRRLGSTGQLTNACTLLPSGGYAVLRQDASPDAATVAMTFGDFPNGHCQADQLSIVLYAAGHHVLPETKYFRYIDPHLTWSKQTISHNTVTVDELSQLPQADSDDMWISPPRGEPVRGRAVFFHPGERLKTFRADCDSAYDGVLIDRTVALVDSVLVDFYRCRSADEHQYDYALHVDGQMTSCSAPLGEQEAGPLAEIYGYRHIEDLRRATVGDRPIQLTHRDDDGAREILALTLLPTAAGELILGNGMEGLEGERAEVVIVRQRATNADFISVMDPGATGLSASAVAGLPDGALGVEITKPDGTKLIILSAETPQTFEYAGHTITAQLALLETSADGETTLVDVVE